MLVIFDQNTYEVVWTTDTQYQLRKPFQEHGKTFWVDKEDVSEFPDISDNIVKTWIPDCDRLQIWEVHKYLLQVISALLSPKFLYTPKEPGYYTAIWMDESDGLQVTYILYASDHSSLSESEHLEGYNLYLVEKMAWTQLKHFVAYSGYRYLRFIPFNLGYTYMYLLHLIESGNYTRDEIESIWKRDR